VAGCTPADSGCSSNAPDKEIVPSTAIANAKTSPITAARDKNVGASRLTPRSLVTRCGCGNVSTILSPITGLRTSSYLPTDLVQWPDVSNRALFHHKAMLVHGHSSVSKFVVLLS
jgi:hypothetical protein